MRNHEELKTSTTSVKMTPTQQMMIKSYAEEARMSVSSYMVTKAMQKDGLTPSLLVKMQHLISVAVRIVKDYEPETAKYLQREMNEIWECLS